MANAATMNMQHVLITLTCAYPPWNALEPDAHAHVTIANSSGQACWLLLLSRYERLSRR